MADVRSYPKEFITEFIDLYRSLSCLWKIKSKEYSDRNKKNEAYDKMVEKMKQIEPDATRDLVTKKINSLRSSYRKEKRKVLESQRSGSGADEVYVPSLWYYKLLYFLDDQETARTPISNFDELSQDATDIDSESVSSPSANCQESQGASATSVPTSELYAPPLTPRFNRIPPATSRRESKKREREVDSVINSVGKRITEMNERPQEDKHDIYGRYVAHTLRSLPNDQRIYLEKIINDAIFEAELGNLNRECSIQIPMRPTTTNTTSSAMTTSYVLSTNTGNIETEMDLYSPISTFVTNFKP